MATIFIALSGGVDSSVAAALLQKEGHAVSGIYLKVWSPDLEDLMKGCPWEEDVRYAKAVAEHLQILFEVWDVSKEYYEKIVSYFFSEYAGGRTPNPDILCNREIKFGIFLERARARGADFVATGHYVRLRNANNTNTREFGEQKGEKVFASFESNSHFSHRLLYQAKDLNKDQSYFLYQLTQEQLQYALFPIGEYTKKEVRAMAREFGLPTADRKDSQGLCFLGKIPVREFLKTRIRSREGVLVTTGGKVVGKHEGAQYFTIGQRHGIGSRGGGTPYFVVEKDVETNTVVVAEGKDDSALYKKELVLEQIHWISREHPSLPFDCFARIRYRQPLQKCLVTMGTIARAMVPIVNVIFTNPQRAVTPGQACVFYDGEHMLGGGVIQD